MYFQGRLPASVNMYWRRFLVADIPSDEDAFKCWLLDCWREKDDLLDFFAEHQRFPASVSSTTHGVQLSKENDWIETEVRPLRWYTLMQIFVPLLSLSATVFIVVGALQSFQRP
jgi:lysocardiolipin and lysophospholipid acyltransferase